MFLKHYILGITIINIVYGQNARGSHRYQTRHDLVQQRGTIISEQNNDANDASTTSFGEVEGTAGVDYPAYTKIPRTSFKCSDMPYNPGMYADLETNCQSYHMCFEGRKNSFLCGIGTVFSQQILACDYWYSVECADTPNYYYVNEDLGKSNYDSTFQTDTSLDNYGSYLLSENDPSLRKQLSHSTQIKPAVSQSQQTQTRETQRWRRPLLRSDQNIRPSVRTRKIRKQTPVIAQQKQPQNQYIHNEQTSEQNTPYQQSEYYEQPLQEAIVDHIKESDDNENIMPHRNVRITPNHRQSESDLSFERSIVNSSPKQSFAGRRQVLPDRQISRTQQTAQNKQIRQIISRPIPRQHSRSQSTHFSSPIPTQKIINSRPVVTRQKSISSPEISQDSPTFEDENVPMISNGHTNRNQRTQHTIANALSLNNTRQLRPSKTQLVTPDRRYRAEQQPSTEQPNPIYSDDYECCTEQYASEEAQQEGNEYSHESRNPTHLQSPVSLTKPHYSQSVPIYSTQVTHRPQQYINRSVIRPKLLSTRNIKPKHRSLALPNEDVRQTSRQPITNSRPTITRYSSDSSPEITEESDYDNQTVWDSLPNRSNVRINRIQPSLRSTNTGTLLTSGRRFQTHIDLTTQQPNIIYSNDYESNSESDNVSEKRQQEEYEHSDEPEILPSVQTRDQYSQSESKNWTKRVAHRSQQPNIRSQPQLQPHSRSQPQLVTTRNVGPKQRLDVLPIEDIRQTSHRTFRNRPSISTKISKHTDSEEVSAAIESAKSERTQSTRGGTQLSKANSRETNEAIGTHSTQDNQSTKLTDQFEYSDDNPPDYAIEHQSIPSPELRDEYSLAEQTGVRSQPTTRLLSNHRQQQINSGRVLSRPQSSTLYSNTRPIQTIRKLVKSPEISEESVDNQNVEISRHIPISNRQQITGISVNEQQLIPGKQQTQAVSSEEKPDYETIDEVQPDMSDSNSEEPITQIRSK